MYQQIAPRIMRDLLAEPHFGFVVDDAAAIVGNLAYETGGFKHMQELKPTVKGSAGGYGWAQWTGPRRRAFEQWAKRKGWHVDSYEANYSFLIRELLTTEKKAVAALKTAKGLNPKTKAFEMAFERAGVKAYTKRYEWAAKVLAAYRKAEKAAPAPAPRPAQKAVATPTIPPTTNTTPPPPSRHWVVRLLMWLGVVNDRELVPVTEFKGFSELVQRVQTALQQLGYAEVGMADGHYGPKTKAAIMAFQSGNSLAPDGEITDRMLAALPKARPRAASKERATTTASDLRAAGNQSAQAFQGLGWLGNLIGIGGVAGGLNETGVFDSVKGAAETATGTLSTIHGGVVTFINLIQWVVAHWWLFAIIAGLWMVYRVAKGVLELVVLFRQGILQRPSLTPPGIAGGFGVTKDPW